MIDEFFHQPTDYSTNIATYWKRDKSIYEDRNTDPVKTKKAEYAGRLQTIGSRSLMERIMMLVAVEPTED